MLCSLLPKNGAYGKPNLEDSPTSSSVPLRGHPCLDQAAWPYHSHRWDTHCHHHRRPTKHRHHMLAATHQYKGPFLSQHRTPLPFVPFPISALSVQEKEAWTMASLPNLQLSVWLFRTLLMATHTMLNPRTMFRLRPCHSTCRELLFRVSLFHRISPHTTASQPLSSNICHRSYHPSTIPTARLG